MERIKKYLLNKKVEILLSKYVFIVILTLSIPALLSLFVPGFYGASDDLHIAWLQQMDAVIKLGKFPPRFVPDLSFGYGYPLFNFVFPLPFYVGEIFHLLGFTLVDSIKTVFLISIPLSGYFMYKFLKEHASFWLALAGAVVYIYTPYRATDIYVRGAIGEIFAFIFPPLIAYAVTKISKEKEMKWVSVLGLATAGLLLSHNIMAYMFFPFLVTLAFFVGFKLKTLIGFVLGLLISIYFWLPAIVESGLMKYDTVFNFVDHFPTLKQLFLPYFGYGASVPGPYDGMSFFMGLINIILLVVSIVFIKKLNNIARWAIGMTLLAIFMMNFRSTILWQNLPLIPYFQFPWRFLSLTTFATSILVITFNKFKYSQIVGIAIIFGAILLNFSFFKPHDFLGRNDEYYLNRYIPTPTVSGEYLKTQEEYLRLPKETEKRPDKRSAYFGLDNLFNVDYRTEFTFDYGKYYFPGWTVKIDGQRTEVKAGKPYGQVQFAVPSGKHQIEIIFKETPFRLILDTVSLLSLVIAITIILKTKRK